MLQKYRDYKIRVCGKDLISLPKYNTKLRQILTRKIEKFSDD